MGRPQNDLSTPALESSLPLPQVGHLAGRDDHEQLPEVAAVLELKEATAGRSLAELEERAQGDILLIGLSIEVGGLAELRPRQRDDAVKVAIPERRCRIRIP